MKQFLLSTLLLLSAILGFDAKAQNYRLEFGLQLGASNYLGDIGGKFKEARPGLADLRVDQTSYDGGLFMRYALNPKLNIRLGFNYLNIRGADSLSTNPGRNGRNLNFQTSIMEGNLIGEFEVWEKYNAGRGSRKRIDVNAYGLIGIGFFSFNPKAVRQNGEKVELAPLETEGEPYQTSGLAKIVGFGGNVTIDRNLKIGLELSCRFTNTDYLDDVSGVYPDPRGLGSDLAREMSDRRAEVNPDRIGKTSTGAVRGNPEDNDAYLLTTLNGSYVLRGQGGRFKREFHTGFVRRRGKKFSITRFFGF